MFQAAQRRTATGPESLPEKVTTSASTEPKQRADIRSALRIVLTCIAALTPPAGGDQLERGSNPQSASESGYAATVVGDVQEAVNAVTNGLYDIVLMDCEMPLLDSLEATRLIRRHSGCEKLPVIALSAYGVED